MKRVQLRRMVFSFALFGAGLIAARQSQAATIVWENAGGTSPWYTAANWNPVTASGDWTTADLAQFGGLGTQTLARISTSTLASLSIGGVEVTSARVLPLTINRNSNTNGTLTLNGVTVNSVANTILRNASDQLLTLENGGTGSPTGSLGVALGNVTNNIVQIDGTGGIAINNVISGSGKKLTLQGSGTGVLVLAGTNTFNGGLTVSGGTVALANNSAAGNSAGMITLSGGNLAGVVASRTIANPIDVSSGANGVFAVGFNLTLNGALTGVGTIDNTADVDTTINAILIGGSSGSAINGFNGTFQINRTATSDKFRFNAIAASSNDGSNAKFVLNGLKDAGPDNAVAIARNNNTVFKMGELSGNGGRIEDDLSTVTDLAMTLEVGNLGTNSSWSGVYAVHEEGRTANFTKVGVGTLALEGNNLYNGVTGVNAGTLLVNGNHASGNTYAVASVATLGGKGEIGTLLNQTLVDLSGTISPGGTVTGNTFADTADTLTIGSLTLQPASAAFFELDAADPGSADNDLIEILGALTGTGGTFAIDVEAFGGGLLAGENTWTLASYGTLAGTLPTFSVNGVDPGYNYSVSLTNLLGGPGEVQLTLTAVPEPGSALIVVMGAAGMGLIVRRKRKV